MHRRVAIRIAAAAVAAALTLPAAAQTDNPSGKRWVEPPKDIPKAQRGDRTRNIDFLLGALKAAPDEDSAKAVEGRIWALWLASGSDTADLLMARVRVAMEEKDYDLAIRLLNAIVEIRPDYVEGWDRRATVYFLKGDLGRALADLEEVLKREPRHFGALAGLGTILSDLGDDKHALEAFRRALAIYPRLDGVADQVKTLSEKVEGRDI